VRNYMLKVVEKLHFTKAFRLYPFPGKYPTRVLVVERNKKDWKYTEPRALMDFKNYKVLYFGKPDLITLRTLNKKASVLRMFYEFDKKNIVYAAGYVGGQLVARLMPSASFYHAYAQIDAYIPWSWFLTPWRTLRIGNFAAYNHFPNKNADENLSLALQGMLAQIKEPVKGSKRVNL
jgi:hypothetical protein